jgi:YspA, cpYpsA-related SLOG family
MDGASYKLWERVPSRPILLVCGGRDYADERTLYACLDAIDYSMSIDAIVHGGARGADRLAGQWAAARGKHTAIVPALWQAQGKAAGYLRNIAMVRIAQPTHIAAFAGGRGTENMRNIAAWAGIPVIDCPSKQLEWRRFYV